MTANQFRSALLKAGVSQLAFARALGHDDGGRRCRRWANGNLQVPDEVAIFAAAMVEGLISLTDLETHQDANLLRMLLQLLGKRKLSIADAQRLLDA